MSGPVSYTHLFPGVTVDQKIGQMRTVKDAQVVDLPGIYSLRPYTSEEIVTRDFILNEKPDGIINIVDATNIERNLYLTLQLLEMDVPMVLAPVSYTHLPHSQDAVPERQKTLKFHAG